MNQKVFPYKLLDRICMELSWQMQVGGGIPKIEEAFLTREYKDQHQEETGLIDELAEEIIKQTKIVEWLLPIHDKYKHESMCPMHDAIMEKFEKTIDHIYSKYGTLHQETFKVFEKQKNLN